MVYLIDGDDFASRLERCIEPSNCAKLIEGRVIERDINHQVDEEMTLRDEVSHEALKAAALAAPGGFPTLLSGGFPTLLYGTYCFTCPASDVLRSYSAATRSGQFPA